MRCPVAPIVGRMYGTTCEDVGGIVAKGAIGQSDESVIGWGETSAGKCQTAGQRHLHNLSFVCHEISVLLFFAKAHFWEMQMSAQVLFHPSAIFNCFNFWKFLYFISITQDFLTALSGRREKQPWNMRLAFWNHFHSDLFWFLRTLAAIHLEAFSVVLLRNVRWDNCIYSVDSLSVILCKNLAN